MSNVLGMFLTQYNFRDTSFLVLNFDWVINLRFIGISQY